MLKHHWKYRWIPNGYNIVRQELRLTLHSIDQHVLLLFNTTRRAAKRVDNPEHSYHYGRQNVGEEEAPS